MADRRKLIIWAIIGTGISSIAVQLVTIREYLSQFHGNEITISLVLFCWLLITGLGSLAARPVKCSSLILYALILVLMGLWPLIQLILIRNFREILFIHGISPDFYQILFYTMVTLAPYCLMLGFILPHSLTVLHNSHHEFTSGELYLTDSIGDTCGGILFSFALVYWVKPFKTVAITSTLMIIVGLILLVSDRRYFLLILTSVCVILFCLFAFDSSFETSTLSKQYGDIVRYVESPYGRIVVSREGPQHTFWESGNPLYSSANTIGSEEKIHYPLIQLERVKSVLLVSGGLGESLGEVEKYYPNRIDYVELDPYLTEAAQEFGFIKNLPGLSIKNTDGRSHIKTTDRRYDAIIVDLPDPDTFQINRFYTSEFFSLSKRILSEGGVLSFGLEYSSDYISDVEKKKLSIMFNTAKSYFQNVMILPGGEAYFLCRDGEISTDIPSRLRTKSIVTDYIDGFYYGNVTKERILKIQDILDQEEYQNTDFEPRIMNVMFQEWFLKHGTSPKIFILILAGFVLVYVVLMRKEEYLLFSTGLANMGVEMLVIFSFQVIYGYIYLKIGAIITVCLLGLLPGAAMGSLYEEGNKRMLVFSEVALLGLILIFFVWNSFLRSELHQIYFLGYCFTFSFFCGLQFPLAAKMIGERQSPAAGCLAADLAGAAVGTLVVGTLLIPLWGIQSAIIFLIMIKISSSMIILFSKT
ncbi:MAG: fused MFS/spermidine synthase [Deltaproteobacteria bacterium]|nr:fused MFS/spermidine synthase [Deltaproteobacteria bacterium]